MYGKLVQQFNEAMDEVYVDMESLTPDALVELVRLKYKLIESEKRELSDHYIKFMNSFLIPRTLEGADTSFNRQEYIKHVTDIVDDLADIIYTCVHMALCLNIDIDAVFTAVHRNNMTKMGPDGKAIKADGTDKFIDPNSGEPHPAGKVVKPDGYIPVDLTPFVK